MRIPLPRKGLSDARALVDQPSNTTADAVNVRSIDPVTGRERLSQRAGLSKFTRARDSDAPVRWIGQVAYDGRRFTYSASNPPTVEWSYTLPAASESRFGVLDTQGNVYELDGLANIVKTNPSGEKVWTLTPPVKDPRHQIRAIFVDSLNRVYVGVSEGGAQSTGRLWCFTQTKGQPPKLAWEVPIDGYVEKVIVRGDQCFTLENRPDRFGAQIVCRGGATGSKTPTVAWTSDVAYPGNDFAIKADGSIVGCSPPFASRGLDPRYPAFTERTVDATLRDILGSEYERLVWRHQKAADQDYEDNASVTDWLDSSGAERDIFVRVTAASQTPPLFHMNGIGGKPAIYFRGDSATPLVHDAMQTSPSPSATQSYSDQHQGLVPGYENATWIAFIVMRPEEDRGAVALRRAVISQPITYAGVAGNPQQTLYSNMDASGAAASGFAAWSDTTTAAGVGIGTGAVPKEFRYSPDVTDPTPNQTSAGVLVIGCDGGVNAGQADSGATMRSFLRWNGKPIDRWESAVNSKTIDPGLVGATHFTTAPIPGNFRGHIAEIIVCHKYGAVPQAGPLTHPHYPHNIHTAAVPPVGNVYNAVTPLTATQVEKIEGMLAHEYGLSHLLPATGAMLPLYSGVAPFPSTNKTGNYPHPFYRQAGPPRSGNTARSEPYQMHSKNGCVWKIEGAKGDLQWVVTGTSAEDGGGLGYAVAVRSDGHIYSVGPKLAVGSALIDGSVSAAGTGNINARCIEDLNAKGVLGFSTSVLPGRFAWIATLGTTADDFATARLRVAVDEFDNLFLPINYPALAMPLSLRVYGAKPDASSGTNVGNVLLDYTAASGAQAYAVALPASPPYRYGASGDWDRNPTTNARTARAEFAYLFQALPTADQPGLVKLRLVAATPIAVPARTTLLIQVVGGKVLKFDRTGTSSFAGASTIAEPQLSPTADFIDGDVLFGKVYLTDGDRIVVVDPINDNVTLFKAEDGGKVPEHCKLLKNWRGCLGLARATDDPQNWHLSEVSKPRSWDTSTQPLSPTRAVSGNEARAGKPPDIVNGFVPYADNILIFLCDHSVWALIGHPADIGASVGMRQVSGVTGGAFGRAWTVDPSGALYWFAPKGGVWRVRGTGDPDDMTRETISERLSDVDLETYRVEMAWNVEDDGLHVFLIPAESDTALVHYFWNRATDSWWSDTFAYPPASVFVADGDEPDDRVLLVGGYDGYVRQWDKAAKNDDGIAIPTRCLIGPMTPEDVDFQFRFSAIEAVLARDQDPVQVSVHVSNVPDDVGPRRATVEMQAGRNNGKPIRGCGAYVWLAIEQSHAQRRWSIESFAVKADRAGRRGARV